MSVEFARLNGPSARDIFSDIRRVYAEVYAEPPYRQTEADVEEFGSRFDQQSHNDGFRFISARKDGTLIGFSYTIALLPGRWWEGRAGRTPGRGRECA